MKRVWVTIESETGKIVFASTDQAEFIDHKFINSDKHDRGNYGMAESTLVAIEKALTGVAKNKKTVWLFDGEVDTTKTGVLLKIEGNEIIPATYAVETSKLQIVE